MSSGSEMLGVRHGGQPPFLLEPLGPVLGGKEASMEKKQPKITLLWEVPSDPCVLPASILSRHLLASCIERRKKNTFRG